MLLGTPGMHKLRFTSFDCKGHLNKLPVISELCEFPDVLFLQETCLLTHDVSTFENLNENFFSFSISAVDSGELLTGRPYGELSILRRQSIDNMCRVLNFEGKRQLGLQITTEEGIPFW